MPNFVGFVFRIGTIFANRLEVDGASVSLPEQSFFRASQRGQSFEGNMNALGSVVWRRLRPFLQRSWRSVVNNSNMVLGGLLTRQKWAPRQRTVTPLHPEEGGQGCPSKERRRFRLGFMGRRK